MNYSDSTVLKILLYCIIKILFIFYLGGCAEKSGELFAGDELLAVNGTDVTSMSRIEAWGLMKRIADGKVKLNLRHRTSNRPAS